MAGINYGTKYTMVKGTFLNKKEGVSFAAKCNRWIVRVLKKNTVTTIAQFKTQEEAIKFYESKLSSEHVTKPDR